MNVNYQILEEERKVIATIVVDGKKFVGVANFNIENNYDKLIKMEVARLKAKIKYTDYEQKNMVANLKTLNITIEELEKSRDLIIKDIMNKQKEIKVLKALVESY